MKSILAIFLAVISGCQTISDHQSNTGTATLANHQGHKEAAAGDAVNGIVFFSNDDGNSWENRSDGLPKDIFLTDIAASDNALALSTKQHGIFTYDFNECKWQSIPPIDIKENIDAVIFFHGKIYVGTKGAAVFVSGNPGESWSSLENGLTDKTIRKFAVVNDQLFAGTDAGLFYLDEYKNQWRLAFGRKALQVNGIIEMDKSIYLATNQGMFSSLLNSNDWKLILPGRSLHNIASANGVLYALAYNELLSSSDNGVSWQSAQRGIPEGKYSFQLLKTKNTILVGQWDGIYKNDPLKNWVQSNQGLPKNLAITEMKLFKNTVIAASSLWPKNEN